MTNQNEQECIIQQSVFPLLGKLKFDYNEYFGSMVSTKPIKKHIRRTKTLEWYIKINRDNFTVNPLGVKTYFPPF